MQEKKYFSVQKLAVIGLMSAIVFVATNIKIEIPTPLGKTMLHFGNVMCILGGLLFGGPIGGLAAGFGSAFFDLLDPVFAPEFPITFIMKFAMGYTAGAIAHRSGAKGEHKKLNLFAAMSGASLYVLLYMTKTFIKSYFFIGDHLNAVLSVVALKGLVSLGNAVIAVIVSMLLATAIAPSLRAAGIYKRLDGLR